MRLFASDQTKARTSSRRYTTQGWWVSWAKEGHGAEMSFSPVNGIGARRCTEGGHAQGFVSGLGFSPVV